MELFNEKTHFKTFPIETTILKMVGTNEVVQDTTKTINMPYKYVHGAWEPSKFRIKLKNTTNKHLYVAMVMYSGRYAIDHVPVNIFVNEDLHGKKTMRWDWFYKLEAGEERYMLFTTPPQAPEVIKAILSQQFEDNAITESTNILKLFASTEEIDMSKFEKQEALKLPVPNTRTVVKFLDVGNRLGFMKGDWDAKNFYVKTVKPLSLKPFGWNKSAEWFGVTVNQHNSISGNMALCTETQASLGLGRSALLPALPENLPLTAIQFTEGWKSDTGLCLLELFDVKASPSQQQPLSVQLAAHLVESSDVVVAVGANKQGFMLAGYGQGGLVNLHALPEATPTAIEGLASSQKISFYKAKGDLAAITASLEAFLVL